MCRNLILSVYTSELNLVLPRVREWRGADRFSASLSRASGLGKLTRSRSGWVEMTLLNSREKRKSQHSKRGKVEWSRVLLNQQVLVIKSRKVIPTKWHFSFWKKGTFCRAPPSRNINIFIKFLRESSLSILLSILMFGPSQIKTSIKHPISGIAKACI